MTKGRRSEIELKPAMFPETAASASRGTDTQIIA